MFINLKVLFWIYKEADVIKLFFMRSLSIVYTQVAHTKFPDYTLQQNIVIFVIFLTI